MKAERIKLRLWLVGVLYTATICSFLLNLTPAVAQVLLVKTQVRQFPDKPSIMVLPFTNMKGEPKQKYFIDGMTEEIITHLSQIQQLFVIASYSTFAIKHHSIEIRKIAEFFKIQYLLKGNVKRSGDSLLMRVQLIDANTEHIIWSESYEREFREIFTLQDEITKKITEAIKIEMPPEVQVRLSARTNGKQNMRAYDKVLLGSHHFRQFNKKDNMMARKLLEEAIGIDPDYARGYSFLALTHLMDALVGWSRSPKRSFEEAAKFGQKALALDETLFLTHSVLAQIYLRLGENDKAILAGYRAVSLNPNDPDVKVILAAILKKAGRHEEAIQFVREAVRLSPLTPFWYFEECGQACAPTFAQEEILKSQVIDYGPGNFLFRDKTIPAESAMRVFYYKPKGFTNRSPIFFVLHGYGRYAEWIPNAMGPDAEKYNFLLIVPEYSFALFPTWEEYNYGNVRRKPKGLWTYFVNDRIFKLVRKLTKSQREKYIIAGHSAGSQFAHRQIIVGASDFIEKAFAANAGDYAMPMCGEDSFPWSLCGLESTKEYLKRLFSIKLYVLLGEEDVKQEWYFPKGKVQMKQGSTRLERGKNFYKAGKKESQKLGLKFNWELITFPGVGHTINGMEDTIYSLAFEQ